MRPIMTTLFCTVGGTPAPILIAVRTLKPDLVIFVCSKDDPVTGRKGSWTQVEGQGHVCSSAPGVEPDQPALPVQLGLAAERWSVVRVPADDPAQIIGALRPHLVEAAAEGEVLADFSGGTKSMAAGLYMAASLVDGVQPTLVTGPRADLIRVASGTGSVTRLSLDAPRDEWLLQKAAAAWRRSGRAKRVRVSRGS